MNKRLLYMLILVLFPGMTAFTQDYIVKIGEKNYTTYEIRQVMEENGFLVPDDVISFLAEEEAVRGLQKEKKNVYKKAFGKDLETDIKYAKAPEIIIKNRQAVSRLSLFHSWIGQKAKKVGIVYLDIEAYWDMVKDTDSYRIREQDGRKLHYSNIPYTFAELQINSNESLAIKEGREYLSPAEFNEYVLENYDDIIHQVKREKSMSHVKNELIKKIAGEKILAEITDARETGLDDDMIEKQVRKYVLDTMFDDELDFTGEEYLAPDEMSSALENKYQQKHSKKLMKMKKALEGNEDITKESPSFRNHVQKAKLQGLKSAMMKNMDKEKVNDWMKKNSFPGSEEEAAFVLAQIEFDQKQEEALDANHITFNFVAE